MPGMHIYFPDHLYEKLKQISKGDVSKICQSAVEEHFNMKQYSLEELEARLRQCDYDKERIESQKEFLANQKQKILAEHERITREREIKTQQEEEKLTKIKKNFMEFGRIRGHSDEALRILYEDYKKDSRGGIIPFLDSLAEVTHDSH